MVSGQQESALSGVYRCPEGRGRAYLSKLAKARFIKKVVQVFCKRIAQVRVCVLGF
jgi:hypothetical protein